MGASDYLYGCFLKHLEYTPTTCQENMLRTMADFADDTESDILVVDGYAGTGKTSAVAAVIAALKEHNVPVVLLAPTGRAAKVLSNYAGMPAFTVHKHIYRQKAVDGDGYGMFSLYVNKLKNAFFFVDEVSLVGIDSGSQPSMFGSGNLLEDLVSFVRNGLDCKLVLIGDRAQLPPVGLDASPALSPDYMSMFGGVRFCSMSTVVRQKKESGILFNATLLRTMIENPMLDDLCPKFRVDGFGDIERIGGGDLIEKLSDAYSAYGEDETIVLCRSNRRAIKYNAGIRATVQYKEEK
ncbi:MAG: ATP-dependent RecD-like DNA helicase, partial [Candidatus Cryptobacteroides sp.]